MSQQNAYLLAAGIIASIYVICAVILILGVREQRGERTRPGKGPAHVSGEHLSPSACSPGFGRDFCCLLIILSDP